MGRFPPRHDPQVLLVAMAEVLRVADPQHPERVSQRAYDKAREVAGYGSHPRADRLAARFQLPWAELRRRVLEVDDPDLALDMSLLSRSQRRRVLTTVECVNAIKLVATRLRTDELSAAQYDETRLLIDAEAERRHRHGAHLLPLPSSEHIKTRLRFADAAKAAGVRVPEAQARATLSRADAVSAFVETFGFLPRREDMLWFGRHHRIQFATHVKTPLGHAIAEARGRFEQMGRWFPPKASKRARPEQWQHLGEGSALLADLAERYPRERTMGEAYSPQEIREGITRAYDALEPGQRLTAARYRALTKPLGLPSIKAIYLAAADESETFRALVRAEAARRAAQARSAD